MKKYIWVLAILLMVSLSGCSNQNISSGPGENGSDPPSEGVTALEEGVWPVNEYTEGLPVPPGAVTWAALDAKHENCSVSLTGMRESEYSEYMEVLKQSGFSAVENVSEEIQGEDYVSVGMLLSNGERWLSISYIPGRLTLYISFDRN